MILRWAFRAQRADALPTERAGDKEAVMPLVALSMGFITVLVVANITAVKLISLNGADGWVVPVAVIAYPFTFLFTDTISEVYGRRTASVVVWLGFAMSLIMVALVYVAGVIPPANFWDGQASYERILGSVPRVVLASMVAYLVSQQHDVFAFHFWRRRTGGRHLWWRNNASTVLSQAVDTALFISIAFGGTVAGNVLWTMMVTQYLLKLAIAALDTPLVYALVGAVRKYQRASIGEAAPQQDGARKPVGT